MAKRKTSQSADETVDVQEVQAPAQPFWEKNQNLLLYVVGGIAVLVAAWFGYKTLIVGPQQTEAVNASWQAQAQFDRDSFKLALENPGGGYDGFLGIIEKYGSTPAGNSAKYYAGVCYLQMGDFDNAIKYLDDFSPAGDILPAMKHGILGDCYSEKKEFDKALASYKKAADEEGNELLSAYYLKKLGMLNEYQGNAAAANEAYERLRRDFPNQSSPDWRDIEKYIYRSGGKK